MRLQCIFILILLSVSGITSFGLSNGIYPNVSFGVVCQYDTIFIATGIVLGLRQMHMTADLLQMNDMPPEFGHDFYIVLHPQKVDVLFPPKSKVIVYQLEQMNSPHWLSDKKQSKEYMKNIKKECMAIVDFKMQNVDFLRSKGVTVPIAYLPVNVVPGIDTISKSGIIVNTDTRAAAVAAASAERNFDILYYGDASFGRRRYLVAAAKALFPGRIKSVTAVFGSELQALIKSAKVVLNLHYDVNSMLETPRLFEALSLGVPVVSELSPDGYLYPELNGLVRYFEAGSIMGMRRAILEAMKHPPQQPAFDMFYAAASRKFHIMLERFLIQNNIFPPYYHRKATILDADAPTIPAHRQIVISPPEFFSRRSRFVQMMPKDTIFSIYDGFLHPVRSMGSAMTYARIAQYAVGHKLNRLTVSEDDIVLPMDYTAKLAQVQRYLATQSQWDYFAGLVVTVPENVNITKADYFEGKLFATIDIASSAGFSIYNRSMLEKMAHWDDLLTKNNSQGGVQRYATMDRHLLSGGAHIVVMLPFFVGHAPGVVPMVWSKKPNQQSASYEEHIIRTQNLLIEKAEAFVSKAQRATMSD